MHIRQALSEEHSFVAQVLRAAAVDLEARGRPLWSSEETSEAAVHEHVRQGLYHLAIDADEGPVGVFRFEFDDRIFWPEIPEGSSAFVHKLAVCPQRQGGKVAQALLNHACALTRQHGRRFLRLDCMGGRPGLKAFYQRFGFRHHSDLTLRGQLFHRFEFDTERAAA